VPGIEIALHHVCIARCSGAGQLPVIVGVPDHCSAIQAIASLVELARVALFLTYPRPSSSSAFGITPATSDRPMGVARPTKSMLTTDPVGEGGGCGGGGHPSVMICASCNRAPSHTSGSDDHVMGAIGQDSILDRVLP
jgi:hypothetical protein